MLLNIQNKHVLNQKKEPVDLAMSENASRPLGVQFAMSDLVGSGPITPASLMRPVESGGSQALVPIVT